MLLLLLAAAVFTFMINTGMGSVRIPLREVAEIIIDAEAGEQVHSSIIWNIRLPRVLAALVGGAALSVAGLLLQIFFRNPIIGPFILGVSNGATLFVGMIMLAGFSFGFGSPGPRLLFLAAFLGSMLVMLVVLAVSTRVKNVAILLVVGLMVGYVARAVTNILIALAEQEEVHGFTLWRLGSFSGFTWQQVNLLLIIGIPLLLAAFLLGKPLNALHLGEKYALSLGVNIKAIRMLIVVFSSLLAGLVTAFAGPVAFVGLAVPHMTRLSFGTSDSRILIPGVILMGAVVTGLCDLGARLILSPVELPISAVTSLFGAPIVIYLLLKRRTDL